MNEGGWFDHREAVALASAPTLVPSGCGGDVMNALYRRCVESAFYIAEHNGDFAAPDGVGEAEAGPGETGPTGPTGTGQSICDALNETYGWNLTEEECWRYFTKGGTNNAGGTRIV